MVVVVHEHGAVLLRDRVAEVAILLLQLMMNSNTAG
jgi:hypothetical protein